MTKINWLKNKNFISFTLSALTFASVANSNFYINNIKGNNQVALGVTTNAASSIGTNLAGIADWSTQFPFLDSFKSSRKWFTQCVGGDPGCNAGGEWDTGEFSSINFDNNGWIKSLPKPADAPKFTKVTTLLHNDITGGRYPGGKYVVLYDGEGTIQYSFDAKKDVTASRLGRDIINVTPTKGGIALSLTSTDPKGTGNYIRNIRVVKLENESTFATQVFNPTFINKISKFRTLRFMDWIKTNNSTQKNWSDRPTPTSASFALKGVPVETMVQLSNRVKADAWITIPHQATDDYITKFAQQVKTNLDPSLKVYVEYSNEVWNWQFQQAQYAQAQAQAKWGTTGSAAWMQWYGMRSAQTCNIWKNVFSTQQGRVVCVMATQTVNPWLGTMMLECPLWVAQGNKPCHQYGINSLAVTGYFGGSFGSSKNTATIESWLKEPDGGFSKGLTQLEKGGLLPDSKDSLVDLSKHFVTNAQLAQRKGLSLIMYEGGTHTVGHGGVENNVNLTNYFNALNRRPEMYNIYQKLLTNWKNSGGTLFMQFVDASRYDKWGSWGALEHIDQTGSPKYNSLMNYIDNNSCWWNSCKRS